MAAEGKKKAERPLKMRMKEMADAFTEVKMARNINIFNAGYRGIHS